MVLVVGLVSCLNLLVGCLLFGLLFGLVVGVGVCDLWFVGFWCWFVDLVVVRSPVGWFAGWLVAWFVI